jgi:nucleoside diphosphate kinase
METTLALIKPDAVHRADEILTAAQEAGFIILQVRRWLTIEGLGIALFASLRLVCISPSWRRRKGGR